MFDSIESSDENRQWLAELLFVPEQTDDALEATEISTDAKLWLAALLSEALSDSALYEQLVIDESTDVDATAAQSNSDDDWVFLDAPIDENSELPEVLARYTLEDQPTEVPVAIVDPVYELPESVSLPVLEEITEDQVIAEGDLEVHTPGQRDPDQMATVPYQIDSDQMVTMPYQIDPDPMVTMPYQIDPDQPELSLGEGQEVDELPEIAVCFEELWAIESLIATGRAPMEYWGLIKPWPQIHCIADNYRDMPPERVIIESSNEIELRPLPCCDLQISEVMLAEIQIVLPGCAPNQLIATPDLLTI
jgi:hypothetical protein